MSLDTARTDAKEQIRQAVDIVDLVGGYVQLRRSGRGYVGLCPWHDDSRPSLQVNPDRQSFKCWVCDYGGDIFSFMMRIEGVEFREALEMLAERAGVEAPRGQKSGQPTQAGSPDDRKTLFRAVAWAEQHFHEYLRDDAEAEPARRYLEERGITRDSILRYHLGFSPESWDWLLAAAGGAGLAPQVLEHVGLAIPRQSGGGYYDRFRGRVLFSIRDVQHRPIAFGGRILPSASSEQADAGAKYINSPETPLFSKSAQLYGLNFARDAAVRENHLIVVEGYTDCIALWQQGIENVVAVLGTALTDRHVPLIRRFADSVTLVLDGDEAGRKRTNEILELFVAAQLDLRILTLPRNLDPCDFIGRHGRQAFDELLNTAVDALEHKIRTVTEGLDPAVQTHQAHEALEDILTTVARAPRAAAVADSSLHLREQQLLARLARRFSVPEENVRDRLRALRRKKQRGAGTATPAPTASDSPSGESSTQLVSLSELDPWDRELIELLLLDSESIIRIVTSVTLDDLRTPICRRVLSRAIQLHESGVAPTFDRLMLEAENPVVKNLLVQMDESCHAKEADDRQQRLGEVLDRYARRREDTKHRAETSALREAQLEESQAQEVLADLIETLRNRQTGSKPTDG